MGDNKNQERNYRVQSSSHNLYHQMTPLGMLTVFKSGWKQLPSQIWNGFICALLIPPFRHEWGRYSQWMHDYQPGDGIPNKKRVQYRTVRRVGHNHAECTRITINVSGALFETQLRAIHRFPDTLLGDDRRRLRFFDPAAQQYFFDRHASSFEGIFNYYQSGGTLRKPTKVPMDIFYEECKFFDLSEVAINRLRAEEGYAPLQELKEMPENLYKRKLWLLFEYPESSLQARIVTCLSIYVIVLSIIIFCIDTIPDFVYKYEPHRNPQQSPFPQLDDPFFFTETVCIVWFTMELIIRFLACPSKFGFLTNVMNIIDLISIVPFFINLAGEMAESKAEDSIVGGKPVTGRAAASSFAFLRVIRLVRVFRIFKLSRHSKGLQILGLTLRASVRELALLLFFIAIGVVLFASAMYFAESSEDNFRSIPDAFWWGVITLTTVGYGDARPKTQLGRFIAAMCCVTGVLAISIPVPVIVSNFNYFYHREREQPSELRGVNPNEVPMCPFLPGSYDEEGYRTDDSAGYELVKNWRKKMEAERKKNQVGVEK